MKYRPHPKEKKALSMKRLLANVRGIPRAVSNLDLDLRESSRGLTIENGSILAIWDRFRSSNPGALAQPNSHFWSGRGIAFFEKEQA